MKSINLALLLFFLALASSLSAQETEPVQKYEYATVNLKINYAGNRIVYQEKIDLDKYPLLNLPDGALRSK